METKTAVPTAKSLSKQATLFKLPKRNLNPSIPGRDYPPQVQVPIFDIISEEVKNEVTGEMEQKERQIRYIRGQSSIYADEQSYKPETPHKDLPNTNIILTEGWLSVDYREATLLAYLKKCNYNGSNLQRNPENSVLFVEFDPQKNDEEFLEKEFKNIELLHKLKNMDANELEALALALDVKSAESKDTSAMRRDVVMVAKNSPEKFKEGMEDPRLRRKFYVRKALMEDVISHNKEDNSLRWGNGDILFPAPVGTPAVDGFVEILMKDSNTDLYDRLRAEVAPHLLMDVDPEEKHGPKRATPEPEAETTEEDNVDAELKNSPEKALLDKAVEEKVITQNGQWFVTEEHGQFAQGWRKAVEVLQKDADIRKWVEELLN